MIRASAYRAKPAEEWLSALEELNHIRLFLVGKSGAAVFQIKDEQNNTAKVTLGNPHRCSKCYPQRATAMSSTTSTAPYLPVCVHILYVLIKVLKIMKTHPLCYQSSVTDNELAQILSGECCERLPRPRNGTMRGLIRNENNEQFSSQTNNNKSKLQKKEEESNKYVKRKPLTMPTDSSTEEFDEYSVTCPICQEMMIDAAHLHTNNNNNNNSSSSSPTKENNSSLNMKSFLMSHNISIIQPLTWCRHGCGNNFHAACMMICANHHMSSHSNNHNSYNSSSAAASTSVKCPLCREIWDLALLKLDCAVAVTVYDPLRSSSVNEKGSNNSGANMTVPVKCASCKCRIRRLFHRCLECSMPHKDTASSSQTTEMGVSALTISGVSNHQSSTAATGASGTGANGHKAKAGGHNYDLCVDCLPLLKSQGYHTGHHFLTSDATTLLVNDVTWTPALLHHLTSYTTSSTSHEEQSSSSVSAILSFLLDALPKSGGDQMMRSGHCWACHHSGLSHSSSNSTSTLVVEGGYLGAFILPPNCLHAIHRQCLSTELAILLNSSPVTGNGTSNNANSTAAGAQQQSNAVAIASLALVEQAETERLRGQEQQGINNLLRQQQQALLGHTNNSQSRSQNHSHRSLLSDTLSGGEAAGGDEDEEQKVEEMDGYSLQSSTQTQSQAERRASSANNNHTVCMTSEAWLRLAKYRCGHVQCGALMFTMLRRSKLQLPKDTGSSNIDSNAKDSASTAASTAGKTGGTGTGRLRSVHSSGNMTGSGNVSVLEGMSEGLSGIALFSSTHGIVGGSTTRVSVSSGPPLPPKKQTQNIVSIRRRPLTEAMSLSLHNSSTTSSPSHHQRGVLNDNDVQYMEAATLTLPRVVDEAQREYNVSHGSRPVGGGRSRHGGSEGLLAGGGGVLDSLFMMPSAASGGGGSIHSGIGTLPRALQQTQQLRQQQPQMMMMRQQSYGSDAASYSVGSSGDLMLMLTSTGLGGSSYSGGQDGGDSNDMLSLSSLGSSSHDHHSHHSHSQRKTQPQPKSSVPLLPKRNRRQEQPQGQTQAQAEDVGNELQQQQQEDENNSSVMSDLMSRSILQSIPVGAAVPPQSHSLAAGTSNNTKRGKRVSSSSVATIQQDTSMLDLSGMEISARGLLVGSNKQQPAYGVSSDDEHSASTGTAANKRSTVIRLGGGRVRKGQASTGGVTIGGEDALSMFTDTSSTTVRRNSRATLDSQLSRTTTNTNQNNPRYRFDENTPAASVGMSVSIGSSSVTGTESNNNTTTVPFDSLLTIHHYSQQQQTQQPSSSGATIRPRAGSPISPSTTSISPPRSQHSSIRHQAQTQGQQTQPVRASMTIPPTIITRRDSEDSHHTFSNNPSNHGGEKEGVRMEDSIGDLSVTSEHS